MTVKRISVILLSLIVMLSFTFIGSDEVFAASYAKVKSLKATGTVYNSTTLTWKRPSSKVKGYRVRVYKYNKTKKKYKLTLTKNLSKATTKYKAKLSMNNKYKFMVYAKYKSGKYSKAVTKIVTPTIARPAVGLYSKTDKSVKLKISKTTTSAKKATGFTVYKDGKAVGSYKTTKNMSYYTVSGLKANTKYRFNAKPYRVISGKKTYGTISKSYYVTTSKAAAATKPSTSTTKPSTSTKPNTSTTPSKPVESTSKDSGGNTTPQSDTSSVESYYKQLLELWETDENVIYDWWLSSDTNKVKAAEKVFTDDLRYVLTNTDDKDKIVEVLKSHSYIYDWSMSKWRCEQSGCDCVLLPFVDVQDVSSHTLNKDLEYVKSRFPVIENMDPIDKIVYTTIAIDDIYDYNYDYLEYGGEHYIELTNNKKMGICADYATAYQYCLNALGVPCYSLISDSENHQWNIVKLNGKYYHVDPTWADATHEPNGTKLDNMQYSLNLTVLISNTVKKYACPSILDCTDITYDNFNWKGKYPDLSVF